ncbi:hypothetical protein HA052_09780 [Chromobacterium haemolyticum]|uniref:Ligand-binding SRPBCC domain-containing protein n=1 Tax=Chromobacterium fluminis TaxID=3044269 RepID=A0ABX0LDS7_9NEIS|nr:hypothetical protein [Chromobacterium haemolyticum]NHR05492.1 hypothetical protein [Chromobacterium haemolyticum]
MRRFAHFTVRSRLSVDADRVWAHATSAAGVNDELWPWLGMRLPGKALPAGLKPPARIGPCWILLFGLLPVECDDLGLTRLEPGAFDERSTMLTQRRWLHRRRVRALSDGCEVVDRIGFAPRVPWLLTLHYGIFRLVFAWRHARLRRRFYRL